LSSGEAISRIEAGKFIYLKDLGASYPDTDHIVGAQ
jgi:hypothetical protein